MLGNHVDKTCWKVSNQSDWRWERGDVRFFYAQSVAGNHF